MNFQEAKLENAAHFTDEDLVALQLRIARRADELPMKARDRSSDMERWLQAEREWFNSVTSVSIDGNQGSNDSLPAHDVIETSC